MAQLKESPCVLLVQQIERVAPGTAATVSYLHIGVMMSRQTRSPSGDLKLGHEGGSWPAMSG